ncbi:MAG: SoxR reducing system RseC family protein [Planctomycetota bacterium]|jgi:positive regulator of sigma E activity|nr:SoxR reducing system RseC family protein [Planctomycetota bacterium]
MDEEKILVGTVIERADGRIRVSVETEAEAGNGCRHCAARSLCGSGKPGKFEIWLEAGPDGRHAPGDQARFGYRPPRPLLALPALFLPALAGLFLGGGAAQALTGGGDMTFVVGSLAGLAAGIGLTAVLPRGFTALRGKARLADDGAGTDAGRPE